MKVATLSAFTLGLLALSPLTARAVEPLDTVSFRIGGYITSWDTKVRADGTTARGTEVDFDRDFGLDDSATIGYVGATWRPWDHHEFGLTYYQHDADATRMITRDITFQDTTYRTNSIVSADVGIDAYEAYYTWWAATHENWALGPRLGLIWYRMDATLALQVDANGTAFGGAVREEASADLPSLTIGGSWRWNAPLTGHGAWPSPRRRLFQGQRGQRGSDVTSGASAWSGSPGNAPVSRWTTRSARSTRTPRSRILRQRRLRR